MLVYRKLHTHLFKGRTMQEIDYTEVAGKLEMDHLHVKVDKNRSNICFCCARASMSLNRGDTGKCTLAITYRLVQV